jgi:hypothetical protein
MKTQFVAMKSIMAVSISLDQYSVTQPLDHVPHLMSLKETTKIDLSFI